MTGVIATIPKYQFSSALGFPLVNGTLTTYLAGTTTLTSTWQDQALTALNTNPVALDARGECVLWLDSTKNYKFVLKNAAGVVQWTQDNLTNSTAFAAAAAAALATSTGSSVIGYLQAAGLVQRTVEDRLQEEVSLFDFIPLAEHAAISAKTSNYDASDNIASAILFCSLLPSGTELVAPRGKYKCTKPIAFKNKVKMRGRAKLATVFEFTNVGDGFVSANLVNGSTAAHATLSHCSVTNTNGANTGGGFVDVGGTFINLESVFFKGWKYGTIFDQTEISNIDNCEYAFNTTGGVWLVNGPTHTPGAANAFTNLINITRNQFNSTGVGIIDDGGTGHNFTGNSFNGGTRAFWIAGATAVTIQGNGIDYTSDDSILVTSVRYSDGTGVGQAGQVSIENNIIILSVDKYPIFLGSSNNVLVAGNFFATNFATPTKAAIGNVGSSAHFESKRNSQVGFVSLLDVVPLAFHQNDDPTVGNRSSKTQFYSPNNIDSALEVYSPFSNGGGTPIGGIDLSANNGAAVRVAYAKIRPAIYGNTAGAEVGGMHVEVLNAGAMQVAYRAGADFFRPGQDNFSILGGASLRWSTVYAGTGAINTSDAREKEQIKSIESAVMRAAAKIKFHQFKFKDAVTLKGEDEARWHFGVLAQEVQVAFASEGLDAMEYGVLCYDTWPEQDELRDEEGSIVQDYRPSGNRYGVRYDELMVLQMAYLQSRLPA